MPKILTQDRNINGPMNIIRLTDNQKVIYVIGDIHHRDTSCNIINNVDIDDLLVEVFKEEKDTRYDLFIELNFDIIKNYTYQDVNKTYSYIYNIFKLADDNFKFENNKIYKSEEMPNVRFHYFDIRDNIPEFWSIFYKTNDLEYMIKNPNYDYILNILSDLIPQLNRFNNYLDSDKNRSIEKIKKKYKNNEIQKKIVLIYHKYIKIYINNTLELANEIIIYIKQNYDKFNNFMTVEDKYDMNKIIFINLNKISVYLGEMPVYLTDMYLIRRILDKDYVKNGIIYCGGSHMLDITYFLVKYFNFKITHRTYSNKKIDDGSIEKLNNYIYGLNLANFETSNLLKYLFFKYKQCSQLLYFPENFK